MAARTSAPRRQHDENMPGGLFEDVDLDVGAKLSFDFGQLALHNFGRIRHQLLPERAIRNRAVNEIMFKLDRSGISVVRHY